MNLVTLTTDFGTEDYFVGAMKGAILSVNPQAHIIDITHASPPHNIDAAAFTLFAAYSSFPSGTIHVCVVDPGVGSTRRAIIAITENHFFVAPDNGVLSLIYQNEPDVRVFNITNEHFFRQPVSATFHGRDVFAPIAGAVSRGVLPAELGEEITDFIWIKAPNPSQINENTVQGEIIHIDHFGNCITNIAPDRLPPDFQSFTVEINNREIVKMQSYFAEAVNEDEIFTIFGSANLLEIAAFQKSAAALLAVKIKEKVFLKRKISSNS